MFTTSKVWQKNVLSLFRSLNIGALRLWKWVPMDENQLLPSSRVSRVIKNMLLQTTYCQFTCLTWHYSIAIVCSVCMTLPAILLSCLLDYLWLTVLFFLWLWITFWTCLLLLIKHQHMDSNNPKASLLHFTYNWDMIYSSLYYNIHIEPLWSLLC